MASVIKDAFNEKEDLFLRKYLGILISKLVGNFSIKFTPELQKKMSSLIRELASSKSNEEIWSSFEIIGHLSKVQQVQFRPISAPATFILTMGRRQACAFMPHRHIYYHTHPYDRTHPATLEHAT